MIAGWLTPAPWVALQKCADASFCNRNRGQTGPGFHIVPGSISTRGAKLSATVGRPDAPNQFSLSLVAYHGFVRLAIDESPSQGRYQVSDVLLPGLEAMEQPWQAEEGKDVTTLKNGVVTVKLGHKPLRVDVSVNGVPALQFNSRDMFNFEHRRQKQVRPAAGRKRGTREPCPPLLR